MVNSVILKSNINEFEDCLEKLGLHYIGFDELGDMKVKMIHEEVR